MAAPPHHRYTITEATRVPWLGLTLAYLATVPIVAGAVGVWLFAGDLQALTLRLTLIWAAAIVTFLAGVRRGLAFRSPHGETAPQMITVLWLFGLGFLALAVGPRPAATVLLLAGFASLAVLDTLAARKEEAPPYFARLRPFQMGLALLALATVLARQLAA